MAEIDLRRSATAGLVISIMSAATSTGWSGDQPRASIEILAVGLLFTLLAVVVVRAIRSNASAVTPDDRYGGFWVRAVAFALDYVPLYLAAILLPVIGLGAVTVPVLLGLAFVYFVGQWALRGQTLGMGVLGLRVIREDGSEVTLAVAARRFLGLLLAFACLFLGVVWVAFERNKRGWADLFGGTIVVRTAAR
jgi:uncharacterized RDD family membrane protein YckC